MKLSTYISLVVGGLCCGPAIAEPVDLPAFLAGIDGTEVNFTGQVTSSRFDERYRLNIDDVGRFVVRMDAGREVRNEIEENCGEVVLYSSDYTPCVLSGSGFIEVDGGDLELSVVRVENLSR